ncbi:hypothetical protein VPH35_052434 [Triticum aestivum]
MEPRCLGLAAAEDGAVAPEPGSGGDGARCAGVAGFVLVPAMELEVLGGGELEVLGAGARGADAGDGVLVLGMELEVLASGRSRFPAVDRDEWTENWVLDCNDFKFQKGLIVKLICSRFLPPGVIYYRTEGVHVLRFVIPVACTYGEPFCDEVGVQFYLLIVFLMSGGQGRAMVFSYQSILLGACA